jgi:small subunit ribosomal protein S17
MPCSVWALWRVRRSGSNRENGEKMERKRGHRRTLVGIVVSDKMDKTVVVQVERLTMHPRFKKYIRRRKKYKAHDEQNACRTGDRVLIIESRPLSKDKRWRVLATLEKAL